MNTGYLYRRLLLVAFDLVTVITGYWVQVTYDWLLYVSIEYRILGAETGNTVMYTVHELVLIPVV